ncbi:hypothetical protein SAMN04488066_12327 [Halorubrum aquaticum]|uniref:Malonate transporter n=1 Tax=Halorubrum aquaticum TaxID=387340 RepID=A0A1I3CIM7_9EURY|nr:AEC family transporter [Halorubrum aquaticum]SFH74372.1 hypothetical protein SAMN04488066_12327 [Halorubrum aquaticum]
MDVLLRLLGMLAVLLVGTGLRGAGLLNASRTDRLNAATYYVALPSLVFVATYDGSIPDLLSGALVVAVLASLLGTAAVAWVLHRNRPASRRSVAVVQSYHSNLGYLGLPLVAATFGPDVTALASVVLGVALLVQVPLTVTVLSTINGTETSVRREAGALARNPVLIALVAGVSIGAVGVPVPVAVAAGLDLLGSLVLPLALLCVGASLRVDLPVADPGATGSVLALKLGVAPAVAWATLAGFGVDAATLTAGVVMLGTPTAVSTYVFATELGGDAEFASRNVFATTVASIASLYAIIRLVG